MVDVTHNSGPRRRQAPQISRVWLLALLVLAAIMSGGALFLKYELAELRTAVENYAESRTGARFAFDSVHVAGFRGVRLDDLRVTYALPEGPITRMHVPTAFVYVDVLDLLSGNVVVEHVRLDRARIEVERPIDHRWYTPGEGTEQGALSIEQALLPEAHAVRVTGRECTLDLYNVVGTTHFRMTDIDLDVSKLQDSAEMVAQFTGYMDGNRQKEAHARLAFAGLNDFDVRVELGPITASDVNVFLPADQHVVREGSVRASARIDAYPNRPVGIWIDAELAQVLTRNQPEFLPPVDGAMSLSAQYDMETATLKLTAARAETNAFVGDVAGQVHFAGNRPEFDLAFEATEIPVRPILSAILDEEVDVYGDLAWEIVDPASINVMVSGTTDDPHIAAGARLAGATVSFQPEDTRWPEGELTFGGIRLEWNSATGQPSGQGSLLAGRIGHALAEMEATNLTGILRIDEGRLSTQSLSGSITGQSFVGAVDYDIASRTGEFELNGGIPAFEDTPLHDRFGKTVIWGGASIRCTGTLAPGRYTADANVDASQARVAHSWWLDKPRGLGATGNVKATFIPNDSLGLDIDAEVAASHILADVQLRHIGNKWTLISTDATSDRADISSIGRLVRVPYSISGSTGTNLTYAWRRQFEGPDEWVIEAKGDVDHIALTPEGGDAPISLWNGQLDLFMTRGDDNRGILKLSAEEAHTPPITGGKWFIDPRKDDPLLDVYPRIPRVWTMELAAANLTVPPWEGTNFRGEAYFDRPHSGLRTFGANVGGGHIQGWYSNQSGENITELHADWTEVPSVYLLDHIGMPSVLTGPNTGRVEYKVDRDDPSTREGQGSFTISGGRFSADYLISLLEGQFDDGAGSLPPSLGFETVSADVEFERDVVRTPRVSLVSEGLMIEGQGQFITDGDVDYELNVSIDPATAERIKPLREGLNLEGMKIAGQRVNLAFSVSGPMFNPRGEVEKLPGADVVLVSGALGVGSNIIDVPRNLLVDLLKLGGGLLGATK